MAAMHRSTMGTVLATTMLALLVLMLPSPVFGVVGPYFMVYSGSQHLRDDSTVTCQFLSGPGAGGLAALDTRHRMDQFDTGDNLMYWVGLSGSPSGTFTWDSPYAGNWVNWASGFPVSIFTDHCCFTYNGYIYNIYCTQALDLFICEYFYYPRTTVEPEPETTQSQPETTTEEAPTTTEEAPTTTEEAPTTTEEAPTTTEEAPTTTEEPPTTTPQPETTTGTPPSPSGFFPILYRDQTIPNPGDVALVSFNGTARSDVECVTICARLPVCQFTIFEKSARKCLGLSSGLENHGPLVSSIGTNVRRRGQGTD